MMFSIENGLAFTIEGPVNAELLLYVTDVILDSHPALPINGGRRQHEGETARKTRIYEDGGDPYPDREQLAILAGRYYSRLAEDMGDRPRMSCCVRIRPGLMIFLTIFEKGLTDMYSRDSLFEEIIDAFCRRTGGVTDRGVVTVSTGEVRHFSPAADGTDRLAYYWRNRLKGLERYELAPEGPAVVQPDAQFATEMKDLDAGISERILEAAGSGGGTVEVQLLVILFELLSRYRSQPDLGIVYVPNGKDRRIPVLPGEGEDAVILRSQVKPDSDLPSAVREMTTNLAATIMHKDLPLDRIVALSAAGGTGGRLTDVSFGYSEEQEQMTVGGVVFCRLDMAEPSGCCPLNIHFRRCEGKITFFVRYLPDHFSIRFIGYFIRHFQALAADIIGSAARPVSRARLFGMGEVQVAPATDSSSGDYLRDHTIVSLWDEQVHRSSEGVAIVYGKERLTYSEVNRRAERLAQYLTVDCGVQPGQLIGLLMERSTRLVVTILGILKAGGAYVPMDPAYPAERIAFILEDSQISLVLTESAHRLPGEGIARIDIDKAEPAIYSANGEGYIPRKPAVDQLAYIIYTSGTTGRPKGVMVEHRNVVQLLFPSQPLFDFGSRDVWLLFHSVCFDFSVWELFGCLLTGGRLVIADLESVQDARKLSAVLMQEGVTVLNQTPSAFRSLLPVIMKEKGTAVTIRYLIFGGEALRPAILKGWKAEYPETTIVNMYGITETTVHVTYKRITDQEIERDVSDIGRSLPTLRAYVLDAYGRQVPVGGYGELYVGGAGVSRGYLNRVELTSERFLPDRYGFGDRMYRSGDRVQVLEDGGLRYLGRMDRQIKIRGYRIEPGEIEQALKGYKGVKDSLVKALDESGENKSLVAYMLTDEEINDAEVYRHLRQRLPEHMVPSWFVQVAKWPLTINGKMDERSLPDPREYKAAREIIGDAANDVPELRLIGLWKRVLEKEIGGIRDNFFESGGYSLKAAQLAALIEKEFGVKMELRDIFLHPTVEGQAAMIKERGQDNDRKLAPAGNKPYYKLSSAQKRMYILHEMDRTGLSYNIPAVFRLEGLLDKAALSDVMGRLARRHASLRTRIRVVNGEPVQEVMKEVLPELEEYGTDGEAIGIEDAVKRFVRPFDLGVAPLWRIGILKGGENEHWLLTDMSHIISDGISANLLIRDFLLLYNGENPDDPRLQYTDYTEWINENIQETGLRQYWMDRLADMPEPLNLPLDRRRPAYRDFSGGVVRFQMGSADTREWMRVCMRYEVTGFMLMLAAYNILLHKLSQQEDIVVGVPVSGRPHPDLQQTIGLFVNTLPFRNFPRASVPFSEFLAEVRQCSIEALAHQDYPYEEIVEILNVTRDAGRNPLYDVMLVMEEEGAAWPSVPGLKISRYLRGQGNSHLDLILNCRVSGGELHFTFEYSTRIFDRETIGRFAVYLQKIIKAVLADPSIDLGSIEVLSEEERRQLLYEFNDTIVPYSGDRTLAALFEDQVVRTPDQTALLQRGKSLSYRELNEWVNRLAHLLIGSGIMPGDKIGVLSGRGFQLVTSIYAVLKAGGSYVPIDPAYPLERQILIAETSAVKLIVMDGEYPLAQMLTDCIFVSVEDAEEGEFDQGNPCIGGDGRQLAYTIYTSGSTGRPKGVMVEHHSAINLIEWVNKTFQIGTADRMLFITSVCFDLSIYDIFGCLSSGATMVIAREDEVQDVRKLRDMLQEFQITFWNSVPSTMDYLIKELEAEDVNFEQRMLRAVFLSGDWIPVDLPGRIKKYFPLAGVTSLGGPTETTVWANYYPVEGVDEEWLSIPYGKPIQNCFYYILDERLEPLPPGVTGELYIGGVCVARGYANDPERTDQNFLKDPFNDRCGGRMYRSGDLGRMLPTMNLQITGRRDHQIKIRGFRVETGEVEHVIRQTGMVDQALVLARNGRDGIKRLVAYVVWRQSFEQKAMDRYLRSKLPEYMVPVLWIGMDRLPLTSNGKIDRKALPDPDDDEAVMGKYVPPVTAAEKALTAIWQKLLGVERVGIRDNFFEAGGHSLKATQLVSVIRRELGVRLELRDVFTYSTVEGLAALIRGMRYEDYGSIEAKEKKDYYELSPAQKRMYVLYEVDRDSVAYNVTSVFRLEGALDMARFRAAIGGLVERHESLRTQFLVRGGEPVQEILQEVQIEPEEYAGAHGVGEVIRRFIRPFDLAKAPLWRIAIVRGTGDELWLLSDMAHIISDGVSADIAIGDFIRLYSGEVLPPLRLQYTDYSEWQRKNRLLDETLQRQEEYWKKEFSEPVEPLHLPLDHLRPAFKEYTGRSVYFTLDEKQTAAWKQMCIQQEVTSFMLLLAVYHVMLWKLSGQEDIVIGTPVSGRTHADLDQMIGLFVNTLPLRNHSVPELSFCEFLSIVKQRSIAGFNNQDYPYEEMVEKLAPGRDMSRNPLFDVMLVVDAGGVKWPLDGGWKVERCPVESGTAKFDLVLHYHESEGRLQLSWEYSSRLFKESTIRRFEAYLLEVIGCVLVDPAVVLGEIVILPRSEKESLLGIFRGVPAGWPEDRTIHSFIEEQAMRCSGKAALADDRGEVTYAEMDRRANQLANRLIVSGIGPNEVVGIVSNPCVEMIIGVLGVLKAGGAYLPIDPDHPGQRIELLLQATGCQVVLAEDTVLQKISFTGVVIPIRDRNDSYSERKPAERACPADLAYIIYTSGSTGNPKGCMVTHRNLVAFFKNDHFSFDFSEKDVWVLTHLLCFDYSVWEIFACLLTGGMLVIATRAQVRDTEQFLGLQLKYRATILNQTPAAFYGFAEEERRSLSPVLGRHLRYVFIGGDKLEAAQLLPWADRYPLEKVPIFNLYGTTETTIYSTFRRIVAEDLCSGSPGSNVGRPVGSHYVYILDGNLRLVPVGSTGEIYIGGSGVSKGYLNEAKLTAERFLADPFTDDGKIYKTGDTGRWLEDGTIESFGRKDLQVKIRGYRVEINEIGNIICRQESVRDAAVILKSDGAIQYLVAFVVAGERLEMTELKRYVAALLPDYMVPQRFVRLEELPLNANGKVDKKALAAYEFDDPGDAGQIVPPRNDREAVIARIWGEILGRKQVGIFDNFFELGGHSLLATKLLARLEATLGLKIGLSKFFRSPTISSITDLADGNVVPADEPAAAGKAGLWPVSSSQERLYTYQKMEPASVAYNVPMVYEIREKDREKILEILHLLVGRHESFRTSFLHDGAQVFQKVEVNWRISIENYRCSDVDLTETIRAFIRPHDLLSPPVRVSIISTADTTLLVLDAHHIIVDELSLRILEEEMIRLYGGEVLFPLELSYRDYAVWSRSGEAMAEREKQKEYWLKEFAGGVPLLSLPVEMPRPAVKSFRGGSYHFELEAGPAEVLMAYGRANGFTGYILFLSVFGILLRRLSGREEFVLGTPVSSGRKERFERVVGLFVNMVVIRMRIPASASFQELVGWVRDKVSEALENSGYPFEELVTALEVGRDLSRHPLFEVTFGFQSESPYGEGILPVRKFDYNGVTSKYDLSLVGEARGGRYTFQFQYNPELFSLQTIEGLAGYFQEIVCQVSRDVRVMMDDIDLIPQTGLTDLYYRLNGAAGGGVNKTLHRLFEEQVFRTPDNIAVICRGAGITYKELNIRANRLARKLVRLGVTEGRLVVLLSDRSIDTIAGMLAILKAGGAYVPIDPDYPKKRIELILEASGAGFILMKRSYWHLVPAGSVVMVDIEEESGIDDGGDIGVSQNPDGLAYVIFTSGSTGNPDGVMIGHRSIVNTLMWRADHYSFKDTDTVLQIPSFAFDSSVEDIFSMLLCGGRLVVPEGRSRLDIPYLKTEVECYKVNYMLMVPQLYEAFLSDASKADLSSLKALVVAGDDFGEELVRRHFEKLPGTGLYNEYGPTENSVCTTLYSFTPERPWVVIGRPIRGVKCFIYDERMRLCPPGVAGQLYIGGAGLMRGYLRSGGRIERPFVRDAVTGEELYATGDLAVYLFEGELKYLGRINDQVKIRGNRVDLMEVGRRVREYPGVKDGVVVVREDGGGEKCLAAYLKSEQGLTVRGLRRWLTGFFPEAMIPELFYEVKDIPLNVHGKVDKSALAGAGVPIAEDVVYTLPESKTEILVGETWRKVLGREGIGAGINFFDAGGNSLKAVELTRAIGELGWAGFSVSDVFAYPTIRAMAGYLDMKHSSTLAQEAEDACRDSILENSLSVFNEL